MSRIGKVPVEIPSGVDIEIKGSHLRVKGPKGELQHTFPPVIDLTSEDGFVRVSPNSDDSFAKAMFGTARSVINNMVVGVTQGFEKDLDIEGVGYRAEMQGKNLILNVGYSHSVTIEPPADVSFEVGERNREIKVKGNDKQVVGQISAEIRAVRPPEPYKGKGIRYKGEHVRRKAGKAGKAI
ncbi:MAG: 50S ribosomal protein L6 [Chloroflexota bacterium]